MSSEGQREGFVAFFDILGFSELIKEEDFSDKIKKYNKILRESIHIDTWDLEYVFFSDSVIINSKSNKENELLQLIVGISEISHRLLTELNLAICGCISYGTFNKLTDEENNVMITGIPILDAIHYEQEQDWIGVMISPRVIKFYPDLKEKIVNYRGDPEVIKNMITNFLWLPCIFRYDKIPFHEDRVRRARLYDGYVITPKDITVKNTEDIVNSLNAYYNKLDEMRLYAPDSHSQNKFTKTMDMINEFNKKWRAIPRTSRTKSLHETDYHVLWEDLSIRMMEM